MRAVVEDVGGVDGAGQLDRGQHLAFGLLDRESRGIGLEDGGKDRRMI